MKKISKRIVLIVLILLFNCFIFMKPSNAAISHDMIKGKWFYIKNAFSGRYLDVYRGLPEEGTNVQQYEFNGGDSQKWILFQQEDGTYKLGSMVGSTVNNGTRYINYVLDVNGGDDGSNGVNLQLWSINSSAAQKFQIRLSPKQNSTIVLKTGPSNYSKAAVVNDKSCSNEGNVFQWDYNQSSNDEWILEPVYENISLGVEYAKANYNKFVEAFPNLNDWSSAGDCANFVSQCLISSGKQHYNGNWKVYRKNENYSKPMSVDQLNNTWELCHPNTSPWISAAEFKNFWKSNKYVALKGSEIVEKNNEVWNYPIGIGDVVQLAEPGPFGTVGKATHTMYIYDLDYTNKTYLLAYHTNCRIEIKLSDYGSASEDKYFIFYDM